MERKDEHIIRMDFSDREDNTAMTVRWMQQWRDLINGKQEEPEFDKIEDVVSSGQFSSNVEDSSGNKGRLFTTIPKKNGTVDMAIVWDSGKTQIIRDAYLNATEEPSYPQTEMVFNMDDYGKELSDTDN